MRLPKKVILRAANDLFSYKGRISQKEVQERISKILNKELTSDEKRRITMILRDEYSYFKIEIDTKTKIRIIYFVEN